MTLIRKTIIALLSIALTTTAASAESMKIVLKKSSPKIDVVTVPGWQVLKAENTSRYKLHQLRSSAGVISIYAFLKLPASLNTKIEELTKSDAPSLEKTQWVLQTLEKEYDIGFAETMLPSQRGDYLNYVKNKGMNTISSAKVEKLGLGTAIEGYNREQRAECITEGGMKVRAAVEYDVYTLMIAGSGATVYQIVYRSKQPSNPPAADVVRSLLKTIEVSP